MMNKVQTSLRLDEEKFIHAKEILKDLGMNFTEAVNIFTSMVVAKKGLPFDVQLPTDEFKKSLNELQSKKGQHFTSTDELFEDLDN